MEAITEALLYKIQGGTDANWAYRSTTKIIIITQLSNNQHPGDQECQCIEEKEENARAHKTLIIISAVTITIRIVKEKKNSEEKPAKVLIPLEMTRAQL